MANVAAAISLEAHEHEDKKEALHVARIAATTLDIVARELYGDDGVKELMAEYENFMRDDYTQ